MQQSPSKLFQEYLTEQDISPKQFSKISGMPLTEVKGIMEGELPVTELRANHLAAAFDTEPEVWLPKLVHSS